MCLVDLNFDSIVADGSRLRRPGAVNLPLDSVPKPRDKLRSLGNEANPLLVPAQIIFSQDGVQLVLHPVGGFLQQQPEPVSSELL